MISDGSKQIKVPMIPPRELVVQKFTQARAPELESLYSTIANRSNNDFKSHRNKRRRTTSYDNQATRIRSRKRQKAGVLAPIQNENAEDDVKKPPRHIRRRKELNKNPESGFCNSGDGTKRLRTHVWLAKRFTMTKRWGFHLPLGLQGRGRGSRALLKWLKHGTIVHDASYYCAVQLEGSQDSLSSILSTVMTPFPSSDAEKVLSGVIYASSMLHHAGEPYFGTIAPITYMWRPVELNNRSSSRQLWIWIHAAAFNEGFNALKTACERQGKIDGDIASVSCISLEGQLGTLEVMGSKASQLLQKILCPVSSMSEKSSILKKCTLMVSDSSTPLTSTSIMENEEDISCSEIIYHTVHDPRDLTKERAAVVPEATYNIPSEKVKGHENSAGLSGINTKINHDYTDLWDASTRLRCPFEESVICEEKHQQRLSLFCIGDKSYKEVNTSTNMHSSKSCPILLLRRNNLKDSITSWSVMLPISWVKAFWVPLISKGARAIGLREKSWVAGEAGIPCFPSEFPECSSYLSLMEAEAAAIDKEANLRPLSMRPLTIPIPPPWDCVRFAYKMNFNGSQNAQIFSNELNDKSLANLGLVDSGKEAFDNHVLSNGVVARTSSVLARFLNAINGDNLLLFPHFLDTRTCISKIMKDEERLNQCQNTDISLSNHGGKVCFLRVILHAYREGVIEEGAVVCAPRLDDIKLWTSGSNNSPELQVPQSSMATYFVKQTSGKWEFQVPEDPSTMESNRWPIGFVTAGFVRGSNKASAGALCDAVLLAKLRQEQWSSVPSKRRRKEIYVLTRNLRSTSYRLTLATIVLEHHQEDIEYM